MFEPRAAALAAGILVNPFPPVARPASPGRPAPAGVGGMPGRWASTSAMWPASGSAGRTAPLPGATGARTALPILARLFERLPAAPRPPLPTRAAASPALAEAVDRLRLVFPPPGAVLQEGGPHVTLRASGGRRPLTFLVDGRPLPAEPAKREAAWVPDGPGFYRVTVLDAEGSAARAEVRVR
ncbi:hypothetical protein ACFQU2_31845 [Siccirubricoccus deserti]